MLSYVLHLHTVNIPLSLSLILSHSLSFPLCYPCGCNMKEALTNTSVLSKQSYQNEYILLFELFVT